MCVSETLPVSKSGKPRGRETFLDMARSMLALGVAVGLILLVTWRPADSKPTVSPVDAHAVVVGAIGQLTFTPLELDLASSWKTTTAWVEQVPTDISKHHWHVSYVKNSVEYVAIDQSDTSAPEVFVDAFVNSRVGTETVNEISWKTYAGENSDLVATRLEDGLVTIVTANSYPLLLKILSKIN